MRFADLRHVSYYRPWFRTRREAESTAEEESTVEEEGGGECYKGGDDWGNFLHGIYVYLFIYFVLLVHTKISLKKGKGTGRTLKGGKVISIIIFRSC